MEGHINENNTNINNQSECIEKEVYVEGYGKLRYYLSNDINSILDVIRIKTGMELNFLAGIQWNLNIHLSENVKEIILSCNK